MVARNGYDSNSFWATKGCLRENGKLIILLTVEDLMKMCQLKDAGEEPTEYLLEKLDSEDDKRKKLLIIMLLMKNNL